MDASEFERIAFGPSDHSTTSRSSPTAALLMCEPSHFGVTYSINPWMDPANWARDDRALAAAARREWIAFHRVLRRLGAAIELMPAAPGLPVLVFTANAALVLDRTALLARFRHPERQAEESHVAAAFRSLQARGIVDDVVAVPDGIVLEGAGDCVWDAARQLFWMGHGPRSSLAAREAVTETFGVDVVALELADPRFYHLDTALSALPGGEVMYVPCAFTGAGRAAIHERVPPALRIEIGADDASRLAANTVCIGDTLVMSACSRRLRAALRERGYRVAATSLAAFQRSGGSAFCLTLRLDRRSAQGRKRQTVAA
jgi:N-dimethylarginine dimethylaminohydrolase